MLPDSECNNTVSKKPQYPKTKLKATQVDSPSEGTGTDTTNSKPEDNKWLMAKAKRVKLKLDPNLRAAIINKRPSKRNEEKV